MWIDWIIIAIVSISLIVGFLRGFVKELISLGAWVIGIWLAINYHAKIAVLLPCKYEFLKTILAFTSFIIGSIIVSLFLNKLLEILINKAGLGIINRFLGTFFGILRGVVLVIVILLLIEYLGFKDQISGSKMAPYLQIIVNKLRLEMVEYDWNKIRILQKNQLLDKNIKDNINHHVQIFSNQIKEDLL